MQKVNGWKPIPKSRTRGIDRYDYCKDTKLYHRNIVNGNEDPWKHSAKLLTLYENVDRENFGRIFIFTARNHSILKNRHSNVHSSR
jgi:hypothetical protein